MSVLQGGLSYARRCQKFSIGGESGGMGALGLLREQRPRAGRGGALRGAYWRRAPGGRAVGGGTTLPTIARSTETFTGIRTAAMVGRSVFSLGPTARFGRVTGAHRAASSGSSSAFSCGCCSAGESKGRRTSIGGKWRLLPNRHDHPVTFSPSPTSPAPSCLRLRSRRPHEAGRLHRQTARRQDAGDDLRQEQHPHPRLLRGRRLQLGGHALFLSARDIQLGRGEPIRDTRARARATSTAS